MSEIWAWLGDLGNSKVLALLIFFTTFVGIVLYVYTGKQRKERLESYKNIPFIDDEDKKPASKQGDK
ncbi:MAG: cbb3-type cytochrome c oxidase subunit 3 [Halothiobacillaceae bacterium]|jgi:cbb3-type cytochrome oxidase subunit 3|uniref:cbb3-type cytochrome oxidase subunit 3 n=1 Tax=Thiofaba sp. EF100 TaxID=3121274 RepID=UPI003221ED35